MTETYIVGTHDNNTLKQIAEVNKLAVYTALMADAHLGYGLPIGGVAAFENHISPLFVGFDIACGNCAIRINAPYTDFTVEKEFVADEIENMISFGMGKNNTHRNAPQDHPIFDDDRWNVLPAEHREELKDLARNQIGTVGAGNHYVDMFTDEQDRYWIGAHFGSRGLGYKICSGFLALIAGEKWGDRVSEEAIGSGLVSLTTQLGQEYWQAMELAGEYANLGRNWVVDTIADFFGATIEERVHNQHNFAWVERVFHPGKEDNNSAGSCVVIRKGATPAWPGQKGFVGGSMCDKSVILRGRPVAKESTTTDQLATYQKQCAMMFSTVHGAGRVVGRRQAKGKSNKEGGWKREPLVTQDMMDDAVEEAGIILRGGDRDESPHVYRKLDDVLAAQGDTIEVLHTLTPKIVCMAPADRRR